MRNFVVEYTIYGIDNRQFYDVRECQMTTYFETAKAIKERFTKIYPLVEVVTEFEDGTAKTDTYKWEKTND